MDQFYQLEDRDGVRFTWNVWPSSRIESKKLVVPIASMYTPLSRSTKPTQLYYQPLSCTKCTGHLNPFCKVDFQGHFWTCCLCANRNTFPQSYTGISETNLPGELHPESTTIEYKLPMRTGAFGPVFLFVIDIAFKHEDELIAMKESLLQTLNVIPQNSHIGLITFGTNVHVYELAFPHCIKAVALNGSKEDLGVAEILQCLGFTIVGGNVNVATPNVVPNKYLLSLKDCEYALTSILEELTADVFPYKKEESRAPRATGQALNVALALLKHSAYNYPGRIIMLTSGPCTIGSGRVVGSSLKEDIRSHHHIRKEQAPHLAKATEYYGTLAARAVLQGHAVDVFSASLDQTGLLEMHNLALHTGGVLVQTESFKVNNIVKDSLKKFFPAEGSETKMCFNGSIDIVLSPEIKVSGAIGHLQSLNKKSPHVGEVSIGIGGTSAWKMCAIDANNTYTFFFDVVNPHTREIPKGTYGMIQFRTTYEDFTGHKITRVTTVAHSWASSSPQQSQIQQQQLLLSGFDQEAAAAIVARLAVYKAITDDAQPIKWVDRLLIQLMHSFCVFRKDSAESLQIPEKIALFPEFMFHLRRGSLIQIFGNSPDETTYFRHYLLRENVSNCLTMIQPSLDAYGFDSEEPAPVLLSTESVKADKILLLDTFFHVVVFSGTTIAAWRKAGYHQQEGHENFKQLLTVPVSDATTVLNNRFPVPLHVVCDQNTSQARFLLAVLDPGKSSSPLATSTFGIGSTQGTDTSQQVLHTDDVPLHVFMEHLRKKVVTFEA